VTKRGKTLLASVALAVALALGAAGGLFHKYRSRMDQENEAESLHEIGSACFLYANEHDGRLPDNLGILVRDADLSATALQSLWGIYRTQHPTTEPAALVVWSNRHCDYEYLGAGKIASQLKPMSILAHEKWPVAKHAGGMDILYGDGHVEWHTLTEAAKLLDGSH
jgi:prepilin-type processing-associated H-X9-DG protein